MIWGSLSVLVPDRSHQVGPKAVGIDWLAGLGRCANIYNVSVFEISFFLRPIDDGLGLLT